ncbi:hypothetical protein C8J57DRAFT_1245670 [Mycena rebaudengoi]|nr:hypothetical protein C8J57DRAFT_1245670 [Mycena rebaudengoi]
MALDLLTTWVTRSKNCPLSISLQYSLPDELDDEIDLIPFVETIIPYSERWEYINVVLPIEALRLIGSDFPLLRSLTDKINFAGVRSSDSDGGYPPFLFQFAPAVDFLTRRHVVPSTVGCSSMGCAASMHIGLFLLGMAISTAFAAPAASTSSTLDDQSGTLGDPVFYATIEGGSDLSGWTDLYTVTDDPTSLPAPSISGPVSVSYPTIIWASSLTTDGAMTTSPPTEVTTEASPSPPPPPPPTPTPPPPVDPTNTPTQQPTIPDKEVPHGGPFKD